MPENTQQEWPRIGSLCSGYGGLDLAVEAVFGGRTVWHAELDQAPARVFAAHWPGVPNYGDIKLTHWGRVPKVDIITAGYPCQPFSHAGKRGGTDDPRHLWPFVAQAVRRVRPRYVVLENVAGHRSLGFGRVLADLAAMRYVGSWVSLRAADVGACHGRERVFILASDTNSLAWPSPRTLSGRSRTLDESSQVERIVGSDRLPGIADPALARRTSEHDRAGSTPARRRRERIASGSAGSASATDPESIRWGMGDASHVRSTPGEIHTPCHPYLTSPDPDSQPLRLESVPQPRSSREAELELLVQWGKYEPSIRRWERVLGRRHPAPSMRAPKGGVQLAPRFVEWMQGLDEGWVTDVAGLTRDEQLRALGNGVVPQQAAEALRRLLAADSSLGAVS